MAEVFVFNIPPWPDFQKGSYRFFKDGEKHITRICNDFVLIFMFEHTLYFTENGREISINPGEWYLQIPGLKQEGRKGSPAPVYYYIHFQASGYYSDNELHNSKNRMDVVGNSSGFVFPIRGKFDISYFKPLIDQLDSSLKMRPSDILEKQAVFLSIMNHLATVNTLSEGIHDMMCKVTEYLALNYNKSLACSDLYEEFHFTVDYITRKMKQYTGLTPWQYVQRIRIEKAKELLNNTDYTLSSIAQEIGYEDISVFYRAFKKLAGIAPGAWRGKSRGGS